MYLVLIVILSLYIQYMNAVNKHDKKTLIIHLLGFRLETGMAARAVGICPV